MNRTALFLLTAAALAPALYAGPAAPAPAPAPTPAAEPDTIFGTTWFDELKAKKDASGLPLSFGAWHWFRFGGEGPGSDGYGIPGLRGTYYWTIDFDPKYKVDGAFVQEVGLHAQVRLREQGTFRPFINDEVWPWETYLYAKTTSGTFKAGQIWKRFGLDWDGVFYGNVAYFDGFKLDPDYGVSWEHTFKQSDSFKVDTIAQFFIKEDGINGTIMGSDAESTGAITEKNTAVVRVVPTWTFNDGGSLALGLSGSVGQLDSRFAALDDTYTAWAADLTYTKGNFKIFGEVSQSHGTINPMRYVSGGPSDKITDYLVGASYKTGPVTWRVNYSLGQDDNPGGEQEFFLPGVTIALTPNVDLYAEYVKWTVDPDNGPEATYEDGYQLILNWRFRAGFSIFQHSPNMKPVTVGAVLYDPKVSIIWDIIREFFEANGCPMDVKLYKDYDLQNDALIAGDIDIAWNSPLAWVDVQRRSSGTCRAIAMRDTDRDRVSHLIAANEVTSLEQLRGKVVAFGAEDSPQARLIPQGLLLRQGMVDGRDYTARRFDLLVGLHGDHIGGEKEAFLCLKRGEAAASALIDLNWQAWTKDGTIDPAKFHIIATTDRFDHCVFAVRADFDAATEARWLDVLYRMDYNNPKHREMMDMEGLKKWEPGRTTGFAALIEATDHLAFFPAA